MADLGIIGLGTYTNISLTTMVGSDPALEVIASADDADYVYTAENTTGTYSAKFAIDAFPAALLNVDTLSVRLRYHWAAGTQVNAWSSLRARVYKSDGTTALTAEATVASSITTTTATNSSVIAFTGVDTAATAADWDGAVLIVYWVITKSMGGDTLQKRVTAGELTGTYTADTARVLSGTTVIDSNIVSSGNLDVVHACVLSGTTAIGGGTPSVDIYYFDGHTSITDAFGVWTGDANAFDDDISTADYAHNSDTSTKALVGVGTTAPSTGNPITAVQVSFNYSANLLEASTAASWQVLSDTLTLVILSHAYPYDGIQQESDWIDLNVPTGGWTWGKVQELTVKAYGSTGTES